MASTPFQAILATQRDRFAERWSFTGIALAMIATALASFLPPIAFPVARRGPLSGIAVAHGIHDFAEFTGGTPTQTLHELETVFVEQIRAMRSSGPSASTSADPHLIL